MIKHINNSTQQSANVMRVSVGNSAVHRCCNTANSSLTIGLKEENMNKRIGSVQFEIEVLRKTAPQIAKPLLAMLKNKN